MTAQRPNVLCISSIDWDFIWQGHQEIMTRLAAEGHRVLFVENTGVRTPSVRDLGRVRSRIRNWWRGTKGFRQERPNLFVYSPLLLPLPYSRVARWINRFVLFSALRRWMRATGFHQPIVWTFLPTPLAFDLIAEVDPLLTIYYCIDDLASSSPGAKRIVPSEERLFRTADLVFATSERLRQRAERFSRNVHLFPFGVNLERFEEVRGSTIGAAPDMEPLRHPVIGYVGGLHQWVDQDLIADVAGKMPDATFALVGPVQTDVSRLERCSNVRLLGQRPHPELPRYVKGFDVGMVPYRHTEYTANVYPTKLNEYLAMGIPVVATDLPEIRRFNAQNGGIVEIAADSDAFAAAIRAVLNDSSPPEVAKRIAAANENSWKNRVAGMTAIIDDALERRAKTPPRWDELLRRAYRRARGQSAATVLGVIALYLLVFSTNLVWLCAEPLKLSAAPQAADAIVVFAGGVGESGQAGGGYQERVKQAVDLYHGGYARNMIFSSGYASAFSEAEVMRTLAVDNGVPPSAIALERSARNTYENVAFSKQIAVAHGWHRVLLVSSPYHMRRALLTWRHVGPEIAVTPTPVPFSQFYAHERGASLQQIRGVLQEYAAIVIYWWRGWI